MYTAIWYTTGAPKSGAPSSPRATHGTHRRRAANRQIQADQNDGNDELSSSPSPSIVIGHHQIVQVVDGRSGNFILKSRTTTARSSKADVSSERPVTHQTGHPSMAHPSGHPIPMAPTCRDDHSGHDRSIASTEPIQAASHAKDQTAPPAIRRLPSSRPLNSQHRSRLADLQQQL
ncbi:hypothetical protein ACLOJK_006489 [Asimina triloba]